MEGPPIEILIGLAAICLIELFNYIEDRSKFRGKTERFSPEPFFKEGGTALSEGYCDADISR